MMKMGKMGPEMEKLKEKYGDDKEGLAQGADAALQGDGLHAGARLPADVPADADLHRAVAGAAEHVRAAARAVPVGLHVDQGS